MQETNEHDINPLETTPVTETEQIEDPITVMNKYTDLVINNDFEAIYETDKIEYLKLTNYSIPEEFYVKGSGISKDCLTLMHVAAYFDSLECYIALEKLTGNDFTVENANSQTPLHYSCTGGSEEIFGYIIGQTDKSAESKTLFNKLISKDLENKNKNLLTMATFSSKITIIKTLIDKGWGNNKISLFIDSAIKVAISKNYPECLKFLFKYHKSSSVSAGEITPLMAAIASHMLDAVTMLIDYSNDINFVSSKGQTALSVACLFNLEHIVEMLLERMIDIDLPESMLRKGVFESAAHWMCTSGNPKIVEMMLARNPRINYKAKGKSCIFSIPKSEKAENIIKILDLLIDHGFILDNSDEHSEIAYFLKAINPKVQVIDWFLCHNINMDAKVNNKTIRKFILDKAASNTQFKELVNNHPDLFT